MRPRNGILSGSCVAVLAAWTVVAPFVFGGEAAADWGWSRLLVLPGVLAVAGGLLMVRGSRRWGGRLACAGGLWLAAGPVAIILWKGGGIGSAAALEDPLRLLTWLAFFFLAGLAIAAAGAHALGLIEVTAAPDERPPVRRGRPCEARARRRAVALTRASQRRR